MSGRHGVRCERLATADGHAIGHIVLDAPARLNSLTLGAVRQLRASLASWRDDPSVACVFIESALPGAFCAGGDVRAMRRAALAASGGPCVAAERFFEHEYRLNHSMHRYAKPIVAWVHGIAMGGGLGLVAGCSHRVVAETARIAMPEVMIGMFPDVGASYFLNRCPSPCGRFLALTGAAVNASDALHLGLADYFVLDARRDATLSALRRARWSGDAAGAVVDRCLAEQSSRSPGAPAGVVMARAARIEALCRGEDTVAVAERIANLDDDDAWLAAARDGQRYGSPLSTLLIDGQLRAAANMSLEAVLRSELTLAARVVRYPEFSEGVRALLVDKDRRPDWRFKRVADVPETLLAPFFDSPWTLHPLRDL